MRGWTEHAFNDASVKRSKPGSAVSTVSDYGVDNQAIEVRSPAEAKGFSL
jgi:hypothetical protein